MVDGVLVILASRIPTLLAGMFSVFDMLADLTWPRPLGPGTREDEGRSGVITLVGLGKEEESSCSELPLKLGGGGTGGGVDLFGTSRRPVAC